jgi:segregation and condensation protein B
MQRYSSATRRLYTERPGNTRRQNPLRFSAAREEPATDPLARDAKLARLEVTLFLADEPLTAKKLAEVAGLQDINEVKQQLAKLRGFYDTDESSFQIEELAGGYQLLTRPTFHTWLLRLRRTGHDLRLTPAALETLAVVAYKQPITRADLDNIRGVACAEMIRQLMEKGLVRLAGRQASLGRPQLYGTTKKFLQVFGLKSLDELPEVDSLPKPKEV